MLGRVRPAGWRMSGWGSPPRGKLDYMVHIQARGTASSILLALAGMGMTLFISFADPAWVPERFHVPLAVLGLILFVGGLIGASVASIHWSGRGPSGVGQEPRVAGAKEGRQAGDSPLVARDRAAEVFSRRQNLRSSIQGLDEHERISLRLFSEYDKEDPDLFEEGLLRREIHRALERLTQKGLGDITASSRKGVEIVRINPAALNLLAPLFPAGLRREWIELDDAKIQGSGASGSGAPPYSF